MSLTVTDSRRERPMTLAGPPAPGRVAFWLLAFAFAATMLGNALREHSAAGFVGYLPAVLALSVLLAAQCVVALPGIARALTPHPAEVGR